MKKSLFLVAVCALLAGTGELALAQTAPLQRDTTKVKMNGRHAKVKTENGKAKVNQKKEKARTKGDMMQARPQMR